MLRQLVVLATDGLLDRGLDVLVPIARAASITDAERDGEPTEHVAFVSPLMKSDFVDAFSQLPLLAKRAPLAVLRFGHAERPRLARPGCRVLLRVCVKFFTFAPDRKSTRLNSSHVSESRMP